MRGSQKRRWVDLKQKKPSKKMVKFQNPRGRLRSFIFLMLGIATCFISVTFKEELGMLGSKVGVAVGTGLLIFSLPLVMNFIYGLVFLCLAFGVLFMIVTKSEEMESWEMAVYIVLIPFLAFMAITHLRKAYESIRRRYSGS
jgi:hypothetical protein